MTRKKYIDKQNWPEYNDKLVRRGEQFFSTVMVDKQSEMLRRPVRRTGT